MLERSGIGKPFCGSMAGMDIQTIFTTPKEDTTWYLTDILAAIGRAILESLW
jgi:hypothetical protein